MAKKGKKTEEKDFNLGLAESRLTPRPEDENPGTPDQNSRPRRIVGTDGKGVGGIGIQSKKRRKDTRRLGPALVVRLPEKTHEIIKRLSKKHNVPTGEIAQFLSETSLELLETGQIEIEPLPTKMGLTLFPGQKAGRTRKPERGSNHKPRCYKGVPRDVVKQIDQVADQYGIPKLEVVRFFFESAAEAIADGQYIVEPKPVIKANTIYPESFVDNE